MHNHICMICGDKKTALHQFPNPAKDSKRFNQWTEVIDAVILKGLGAAFIFKNRRVCRNHFEKKYLLRSNRVSSIAVPTLNLNKCYSSTIAADLNLSGGPITVPLPTESDEIESLRREFQKSNSMTPKEKVKLIDKTAAWLDDAKISENTKANAVGVIFTNKMIFPEIANHPILLQMLIKPKDDSGGIFNKDLFECRMKPIIVKLFESNEARVRLKLLDCFSNYFHTFTEEELKLLLLPEILKGMQDIDITIVSATLLCLARLVEILGPQVVIGGTRKELFVYNDVGPREEIVESAENKVKRNDEADNDAENIVKKRIRKRKIKKSYEGNNYDSAYKTDNESGTKNRVDKTRKKRDREESYEGNNDVSAKETNSESGTNNRVNETVKKREIKDSDQESNDDSANETQSDIDAENRVKKRSRKRKLKKIL